MPWINDLDKQHAHNRLLWPPQEMRLLLRDLMHSLAEREFCQSMPHWRHRFAAACSSHTRCLIIAGTPFSKSRRKVLRCTVLESPIRLFRNSLNCNRPNVNLVLKLLLSDE